MTKNPHGGTPSSFKLRYFAKLSARVLNLALGLVTAGIVPRSLGVVTYGVFGYLEVFYNNLSQLIDSGASAAYFNRLSREPQNTGFTYFYALLMIVVLALVGAAIVVMNQLDIARFIFPGVSETRLVYMGFVLMALTMLSQMAVKTADALALTVRNELLTVCAKSIFVLLIIVVYTAGLLNIGAYYFSLYVQHAMFFGIGVYVITRAEFFRHQKEWTSSIRVSASYLWRYSRPLISFAIFNFVIGILDRWYLQNVAGSVDQSMFTLSFKIAQLVMLFVSSMTPLLQRDISIAHAQGDVAKIAGMVKKYGRMMFVLAAYFSFFIANNSSLVPRLFGGGEFQGVSGSLMVMSLYPLHQSYGQVIGSYYFSSENTSMYKNISLISGLCGMVLTYLLLAPSRYGGLELGAFGLALKVVIVQFLTVNVLIYKAYRGLSISYLSNLLFQVRVSLLFFLLSFISSRALDFFDLHFVLSLLIRGGIYTALCGIGIFAKPSLFGIDPSMPGKMLQAMRMPKKVVDGD